MICTEKMSEEINALDHQHMIGQGTRFISGTTFSANSDGKVKPLSLIEITELVLW